MNVKAKLEGKAKPKGLTFQELILKLMHFWDAQGCVLQQPYDTEVGAGTMHPETFSAFSARTYRVALRAVLPARRRPLRRKSQSPVQALPHQVIPALAR